MLFQEIYWQMLKIILGMNAIILIPVFILFSIGLYTLAKKQDIQNPWLAWIPVVNYFVLGTLIKDAPYIKKKFKRIEIIALICGIAYFLSAITPILVQMLYFEQVVNTLFIMYWLFSMLLVLVSLGTRAFAIFMYYHLFKIYAPKETVLYTVMSVFSLSYAMIFSIRNYEKPLALQDEDMK